MSIYNEENYLYDDSQINVIVDTSDAQFYTIINTLSQLNSNVQQISSVISDIISNSSVYLENVYTPIASNDEIPLSTNKNYIFITQNSPISSFLPSNPTIGEYITVFFEKINNNNLFFYSNGNKINGINDNFSCNVSSLLTMVYINSAIGWRVVPYFTWN